MAHFQAVTASNSPRVKKETADNIDRILEKYLIPEDLTILVESDLLSIYGYTWPDIQKLTEDEYDVVDEEGFDEDGLDGLQSFLQEIQPYLEEALIIQSIGNERAVFPLSATKIIVPPEGDIVVFSLDGAADEERALTPEKSAGNDYILKDTSCWITVGGLSVYVQNTGSGVAVDIFPRQKECEDPIASAEAEFPEDDGQTVFPLP